MRQAFVRGAVYNGLLVAAAVAVECVVEIARWGWCWC